MEPGRPIFFQIAEWVEEQIISGALPDESRAPSSNELALFYHINPATAAKGVGLLVDRGVLYKRRGLGMFVAPGARLTLLEERRQAFAQRFIRPLLAEGARIGLDREAIASMVRQAELPAPEVGSVDSPVVGSPVVGSPVVDNPIADSPVAPVTSDSPQVPTFAH